MRSPGRSLILVALIAAALVVALLLSRHDSAIVPAAAERLSDSTRQTATASDSETELVGTGDAAMRVMPPRAAAAVVPDAVETTQTAVPRSGTLTLLARFEGPDGQDIAPPSATIELTGPAGSRRSVAVASVESTRIEALDPGRWSVRVDAPGFVHREQAFDLEAGGSAKDPRFEVEETLVLWPAGWIAVIARTSDGRPFRALAEDLGWEPKRLFANAFEVRARVDPPDERAWNAPAEDVARFRPPTRWELPGGALGSLELVRQPPLWVGLIFLGVPVGWELVRPGANEVAFTLDAEMLDVRLARVTLRVVDAATGAPVPGARVTLRADVSTYRRPDLQDVITGADGRVSIARAIPGGHELSIAKEAAVAQEHVELAPGETRELGDVPLASGAPIPLRVVDANGAPVARAYVEVGRHVENGRVSVLYPSMLRYTSGPDGRFDVPRPATRAIVRAAVEVGRSHGRIRSAAQSANALVEPDASSQSEVVLVLRDPVPVRFETHAGAAATIEVADELGVVVDWTTPAKDGSARLQLLAGRYRARFLDAAGRVAGEAPFDARGDATLVLWP